MGNNLSKEETTYFKISDEFGELKVICDGKTFINIKRINYHRLLNINKKWWDMINGGREIICGMAMINYINDWHIDCGFISFHVNTIIYTLNSTIKAISKVNYSESPHLLKKCKFQKLYKGYEFVI